MGKGTNDLNMLLKAKVVKVMVELDIPGSMPKIKRQVDEISRKLANKPIKLKVTLNATMTELNSQLKTLTNKLSASKSFKPIKIKVQIDVAGSATHIKKQLQDINKTVEDFNKKYGRQVQKMQENANKMKQATQSTGVNVPTSGTGVENYNNMKQYTNQLKEAERIMRSKVPKGVGLFGTNEIKDAKGNLTGFIATLERANGIIDKTRYSFNKGKGTFEVIDRQTATNTEKQVHKAMQNLRDLQRELSKTGAESKKFQAEYNTLMKNGENGTLTGDSVKAFQTKIKNAETEIRKQKELNELKRTEAKLLRDIREVGKGTQGKFVPQTDALLNRAKSNQDAENYKAVRAELGALTAKVKEYKSSQKEASTVTTQKAKALKELTRLMRETHETEGALSRDNIKAVQQLVQRATTLKQVASAQKQLNNMQRQEKGNKDAELREAALRRLKTTMIDMARVTGTQISTIESRFSQLSRNIGGNIAQINSQIATYQKTIARANDKSSIANLNRAQEAIVSNANGFSHTKMKGLINEGDITKIKDYLATTQKLDIATAKIATNSRGISTITTTLASTGKTAKQVTYQIDTLTNKLKNMGTTEVFNRNANLGIFEQLRIAMARVPIWMTAMTAFYGSIRSVKAMMSEILQIDKAMTELRRVASDSMNLDHLFKGAVDLSKELGNNIHDVMQSVNDLARTYGEFNERQILAITKTATLMANVSDLNAQESTESLIGTMNAFNITAEDSIRIVDSLNEVDNNYAISTKQLATGLQKSASTAKTFGASLEETTGHITAIGSVTMESGNIIGNSLKTIYSRMTTMNPAIDALDAVGVSITNMETGGVKKVNEILGELAGKWYTLTDAERQNTAVQVAGRYQLSRFLALMNNYGIATDATSTAINSQGSAVRENAQFIKSYESRINQLKNAFTEFSSAVGTSGLSSAMDIVIRGLTSLAETGSKVVSVLGLFPIALGFIGAIMLKMGLFAKLIGTTGTMLGLMRGAFVTSAAGATLFRGALAGTVGAFTSMQVLIPGLVAGVKALGVAFMGLMSTLVVGAIFVAIGYAITKLVQKFNDAKVAQEAFEQSNKDMITSFRMHADGMNGMVDRYDELKNKTNLTSEEQAELNKLISDFAGQLPTTIDYMDANGQAHLKTTGEIKSQIKAVKELSKAQADLTRSKFEETMKKETESYQKIINKINELSTKKADLEAKNGKTVNKRQYDKFVPTVVNNDDAIAKASFDIAGEESKKTQAIQQTILKIREQTLAYFESEGKLEGLGDKQKGIIEGFSSANEIYLRASDNTVASQEYLYNVGVQVGEVFSEAFGIMTMGLEGQPEKIAEVRDAIGNMAEQLPDTFLKVTDEFGEINKSTEEVVKNLQGVINVGDSVQRGVGTFDELRLSLMGAGMSAEESTGYLTNLARAHGNAALRAAAETDENMALAASMAGVNDEIKVAIGLQEIMTGQTNETLSAIENHAQTMMVLTKVKGEAAMQDEDYRSSLLSLADHFNVSTSEIEKNTEKYLHLAQALQKIDWSTMTTDQTPEKFLASIDGIGAATERLVLDYVRNGEGLNIFTGKVVESTDSLEESAEKVNGVKANLNGIFQNTGVGDLGVEASNARIEIEGLKKSTEPNMQGNLMELLKYDASLLGQEVDTAKSKTDAFSKSLLHDPTANYMLDAEGKMATIANNVERVGSSVKESAKTTGESVNNAVKTGDALGTIDSTLKTTTTAAETATTAISGTGDEIATTFTSMSSFVSSNTLAMIAKHNSQKSAIETLASAARIAKADIANMNKAASNSNSVTIPKVNGVQAQALSSGVSSSTKSSYVQSSNEGLSFAMSAFSDSVSSAFSASSGESGESSSSQGGGEGSSGIMRSSIYDGIGQDNGFFSSLAIKRVTKQDTKSTKSTKSKTAKVEKPKPLADLYGFTSLDRKSVVLDGNLNVLKAKIEALNKNTKQYRESLRAINRLENEHFKIISQQLRSAVNENKQIEVKLKKLPAIGKHNNAQRDQYNKLQQDFDSNLSKIATLKAEVASATVQMKKDMESVFIDLIDEIVEGFNTSIDAISDRISNIDFKLEVFELTDPDNVVKKMELLAEKTIEYVHERKRFEGAKADLEIRLAEASRKYGKNSDSVKKIADELLVLEKSIRESTLNILRTEKEIKDTRGEVADSMIEKMKDHYKKAEKMALDSSNKQTDTIKKAHDAKMKLYDAEIKKIEDVYSAKIKSLDDEDAKDNYDEELSEKATNIAELTGKRDTLSRDTSPEGKKKLSEIQKELEEAQKELDKFMKSRQKELLKEQLTAEKDAQVEEIQGKKDHEQEMTDAKLEALEKERDAISEHYAKILDDEDRWAKIRGDIIKGNFSEIQVELKNMGILLTQLSNGTFEVLSEDFKKYSDEVKAFVVEMNKMINEVNTNVPLPSQGGSLGNGKDSDGIVFATPNNVPKIIAKAKNGIVMDEPTPDKDRIYNAVKNSSLDEKAINEIFNKAQKGETLVTPTAEKSMFYNMFLDILGRKIPSYDTGGYTGNFSGGRPAIVHEKELILNKNQTGDILNVVKLTDKLKNILPLFSVPNMSKMISQISSVSNNDRSGDEYNLTINIEKLTGDKEGANLAFKEVLNGLKKMGKK